MFGTFLIQLQLDNALLKLLLKLQLNLGVNMRLGVPEIITTLSPEPSWPKSSRRASFSGIQDIQQPRGRLAAIQVTSLPIVTRRSSVCNAQLPQPPVQRQGRSDPILEQQQQHQQSTSLRRGSIVTRARSNSVFGLGLPAIGFFRGRRRSRTCLSAREIKIFQVRAGL